MYYNRVIKYDKNFIIPQEIMEKILRYNVMTELLESFINKCWRCSRIFSKIDKYYECNNCSNKMCNERFCKLFYDSHEDANHDYQEYYCWMNNKLCCYACTSF